jgi:PAS domain S-box-containing protein
LDWRRKPIGSKDNSARLTSCNLYSSYSKIMLRPFDPEQIRNRLSNLEREEDKLWRISLLMLALLGTALLAAVWEQFTSIPLQLRAIPVGAVVLAVLFALYAAARRREAAELRGMLRGIQQTSSAPPSQEQLGQLVHAISESQRNYRELIDSFADAIVTFSAHGIIQAANRAFVQLVEKDFPQVIGHSLEEFLAEPTREQADRALPEFLNRRQWAGVVPLRLRRDDRVRYFECVLNPIFSAAGELTAISALATDITEEREREARFSELFESLPQGVFFSTPEGKLLDCNAGLVALLGYEDKKDLLAVPPQKLYPAPETRSAELQSLLVNPLPCREIALCHKSGRLLTCLETARPVFDRAGNVSRYHGVLIDITNQRAQENATRSKNRLHQQTLENFPDIIVVLDREGNFTYANSRLFTVLDYSPQCILGKPLDAPGSPVAGDAFRRVFADLLAGKAEHGAAEYIGQHRNGTWRALRATAHVVHDQDGQPCGVVAGVRDVTRYRQQERQLIQSERLAAIGQMIDGFAHELNNPLTAIVGTIDLLEGNSLDENVSRRLQTLKTQARRAVTIVQNLLFFSRPPSSGNVRLDLSELVQRTIALQEHSLLLNNINVDFIPEPGLPPILGDPNQLMQVFLNLLINAEQAIREVRSRGTIRVRLGTSGDRIWVSMQDDGPGITEETVKKMFDPFYTTKRPGRGVGLGLSVAVAILKEYSGTIDAQPGPGGGAVFTVSLPLKHDPADATTAEQIWSHPDLSRANS